MKKLLIAVVIAAATMTGACSDKTAKTNCAEASLKTRIENCTNEDSLAIYLCMARDHARALVNEGKTDEARKYMDDLTPAFEKHRSSIKSQWKDALASIAKATDTTTDSIKAKSEAVKDAAAEKVDELKDAASEKFDKAKEGTKKAVNSAVENTQNALEKMKQ